MARFLAAFTVVVACLGRAEAIDEIKDEKAKLKACQRQLCSLVTKKAPPNGDFACTLTKTWRRKDLEKGSEHARMTWGFGDAQCVVDLKVPRAAILDAVKAPKSTLRFPQHEVNCLIEQGGGQTRVQAMMEPKAEFEAGRAKKVWVNLKKVNGPTMIKGLAYSAAKLGDNLGLFRKPLTSAINDLIHQECPKVAKGG